MSNDPKIEELQAELSKLRSQLAAMETLCCALFYVSDDKPLIIDNRRFYAEEKGDELLHDASVSNEEYHHFLDKSASIEDRLSLIRSMP